MCGFYLTNSFLRVCLNTVFATYELNDRSDRLFAGVKGMEGCLLQTLMHIQGELGTSKFLTV